MILYTTYRIFCKLLELVRLSWMLPAHHKVPRGYLALCDELATAFVTEQPSSFFLSAISTIHPLHPWASDPIASFVLTAIVEVSSHNVISRPWTIAR